jgi:MFS family permease
MRMTETSEPTSPLRLPLFRAVWFASLASNFGGLIQSVGASWTMTGMGASAEMIALVQSSISLPIVLLSVWAGAVADNLDRRKVMLCAQGFMLLTSLALAAAAYAGILTPWTLLLFTFLIGCGTAVNGPAWQASVGDMVPRPMLPEAVALNSMGFNIARSVGPAIGGAIVAAFGASIAFLTNAITYTGLIFVLGRWKPNLPPRTLPRERIGLAMLAGVRYVRLSPSIRNVLVRSIVFCVPAAAVPAMMPLVARDLIGGGPLTFGLLLGGFGIGAVCGALSSRHLRRTLSTEQIVRMASAALAVGATATGLLGYLIPTLIALAVAGAGWVLALSTFNVEVQMASPRWVVARALALAQMAAFGGLATGSWLFGVIADQQGVTVSLCIAGGVSLICIAVGFVSPLPTVEDLDLAPFEGWSEPDTAIPVEPRSGPIVITIEHRVPEANIPLFLIAMNERKRIRGRDGASAWTLMRDLGDPQLWVERYHVATWLDYIRHNKRRTNADQANSAELRRLRVEGYEPVVHRRLERQTSSIPTTRGPDPRELDAMTDPTRST